jgi:hypothetical protein
MTTDTYTATVLVPNVEDLEALYPRHARFARTDGKFLFDLITSPASYIRASVATEDLGLPAVAGIAKMCHEAVQAQKAVPWSDRTKQFIGVVTSVVMQANGFQKTGTKKAIPHPAFTKGEFYQR